MIYIRDRRGGSVKCRALLDTCATANFISESIVKRLDVHVTAHSLPIGGINSISTESRGMVRITIQSAIDGFSKELTCLTIPAIADLIPSEVFPRNSIKLPPNIRLADPEFHLPRSVDLLIGSGATLSLFAVGQINLSREGYDLYLQKTRLGWVVAGNTSSQNPSKNGTCHLANLEDLLLRFWTVEEVAMNKPESEENTECETHFIKTVTRDVTGRYTVRLPFRNTEKRLGESRALAFKRLASLERRLNANSTLKNEYTRSVEEYLSLGHMSRIDDPGDDGYYMPHHAVIKESSNTTKVRIVFDASARSNTGVSLNEMLLVGPTIQNTLTSHLIRFRAYNYVVTADIEKMYRQIWLHEEDRPYQRILWRRDRDVETFQLNTLTFGVSSSPFLTIRTVHKLAEDESLTYPRAARILKTHLYVDDLLTGADTIDEARAIRNEIIALLSRGGFAIRQWASNDVRIINDLPSNTLHANFALNVDRTLKTLGVTWSTRDDKIYYSTHPFNVNARVTKRNILSDIAKIYDPVGFFGPPILYAKKLMQDVWRCGLHWDESVPQNIFTEWSEFAKQWELLDQISFDRKILVEDPQDVQLHGFCDASNNGYGACLYVRSRGRKGNTAVRLLCAKSRVAPLKTVTIPRLELCGALLLAQLYREASNALDIIPNKIILWCDSTIVLHWLKTAPHLLQTYVANRVVSVRELTGSCDWRHVRSEHNPADALSRGQMPRDFLKNQTWSSGPPWLIENEIDWPNEIMRTIKVPELKKNTCLVAAHYDSTIFERFSSYSKLLRVIARCLRVRPDNSFAGPLCAEEINNAEKRILKVLQASHFSDEIKKLKNKAPINKSKIANLNPFIDDDGLMRVGGRLQMSSLSFTQKHPVLIPNRHYLSDCIIREIHEKHHHAGIQHTLYFLRQNFWLSDSRNQVRKIIRKCVRCFRFDASAVEYKMGNLPPARVREAMPFSHTGIDYCGPFYIKERKFRNRTRVKVYVCIFICMAVKAVHLEVVSDLSSEGFLAALRRFIARRGMPEHVYSDNGTNFVGANNQLKEIYALFNSEEHKDVINRFASEHRVVWHFIPPLAPHFGGAWESMVKLFKHHLKRVVGDSLFTFEEFNTFTTEVEGILNSRPITSISSDPNDILALSPAHCLIGKPITALPEGELTSVPVNRLSTWQHLAKVRQDFWKRWSLEYLNELQTRNKWNKDGPKLDVGTVVLVKEKNLPSNQWALGRIVRLHPGEDKIVRAATIKTAAGELNRAAKSLCPLPLEQ
ncbi:PREDICTED: uncharacterized protein LOC105449538 [Wasmannia auropunctata]|uniref:uncharacterized protein LOC105449538 n=1 Tax=Wasmannia auropunctata TaxID=64793 RepID=UPI0005F01435|nr:PREDICTED: uncharacterized protein LOC105449538 [Wasmannia auropunctata]